MLVNISTRHAMQRLKKEYKQRIVNPVMRVFPWPVLKGRELTSIRGLIEERQFGLPYRNCTNGSVISLGTRWLCTFKSGSYDFCGELKGFAAANLNSKSKGPQPQGRSPINFIFEYDPIKRHMFEIHSLNLRIDEPDAAASRFEDIRLFKHLGSIWISCCYGGGNRAWPVMGKLPTDNRTDEVSLTRVLDHSLTPPQKNWLPFTMDDQLYFITHISPHRVIQVTKKGEIKNEWITSVELPLALKPFFLRGSAAPIMIRDDIFLGAGHIVVLPGIARTYLHFFYEAQSTPPFRILRISRPFKIFSRQDRVQFLMSLCPVDDGVVLSVGICDCDSIMLKVKQTEIERMFV